MGSSRGVEAMSLDTHRNVLRPRLALVENSTVEVVTSGLSHVLKGSFSIEAIQIFEVMLVTHGRTKNTTMATIRFDDRDNDTVKTGLLYKATLAKDQQVNQHMEVNQKGDGRLFHN